MPDTPAQPDFAAAARRLFQQHVVWDDHAGFGPSPTVNLGCLEIWQRAGVDYLSINVGYDVMDWRDTVKSLAAFRRWILASPGHVLVDSVEQVRQAKRDGKLAVTFDLEGMNALDGQLDMVATYHALGVRQMLFAYNRDNLAGGGCHEGNAGLTAFGRQVIGEMNRVGMVVDVSHCAYRTSMEAMELSADPVIFSHSNPRALWDHERNILDEQARACAATGGVVGVVGIGIFLGNNDTTTGALANHVDYLLDLIGPRHVGIGLDYPCPEAGGDDLAALTAGKQDYWPKRQYDYPRVDCAQPRQILELAEELLRRQHAESTVAAVPAGNFMRVAERVWKPAQR